MKESDVVQYKCTYNENVFIWRLDQIYKREGQEKIKQEGDFINLMKEQMLLRTILIR